MTDEQYLAACKALGQHKDADLSKAVQVVLQEAHRRVLVGMEVAEIPELPRMQAQALQLRRVLEVLQSTGASMTI